VLHDVAYNTDCGSANGVRKVFNVWRGGSNLNLPAICDKQCYGYRQYQLRKPHLRIPLLEHSFEYFVGQSHLSVLRTVSINLVLIDGHVAHNLDSHLKQATFGYVLERNFHHGVILGQNPYGYSAFGDNFAADGNSIS
jgi:hypothetical protein